MEEKKSNKGLVVTVIILIVLLLGAVGYICYDKFLSDGVNPCEQNEDPKSEVTENNSYENSSLIEKRFQLYADNLKKQMSEKYSKNVYNSQSIDSSYLDISDFKDYGVDLDKNGNLSIQYYNESNKRQIASNVLNFYIISSGQGGGNMLYFINDDGTVGSADIEYGFSETKEIKIINKLDNLKYITNVVSAMFGDSWGAIFIDIDGNMYEK